MEFYQRLIELRKKRGLTQSELAELVNISRSALSLYELGRREPDHETIKKLADFFGCSVDYLLGRTDLRSPVDSPKEIDDLEEFLHKSNIKFDGAPLDEEDKQDILEFLKVAMKTIKKRKGLEE